MILHIVSIRDRQIGAYMTPFFAQSEGAALRSFSDEVNRAASDNILFRHPEDFELFYLGTFDSDKGIFDSFPIARLIISGSSVSVPGGADPRQQKLGGV